MNEFWKWMKKKKYCISDAYDKGLLGQDGKDYIDFPTKQMLIGYMIEYLMGKGKMGIYKGLNRKYINLIDEFIQDLEKTVKEIKHE